MKIPAPKNQDFSLDFRVSPRNSVFQHYVDLLNSAFDFLSPKFSRVAGLERDFESKYTALNRAIGLYFDLENHVYSRKLTELTFERLGRATAALVELTAKFKH